MMYRKMTPAQKRAALRKEMASRTPEERSEISRERDASMELVRMSDPGRRPASLLKQVDSMKCSDCGARITRWSKTGRCNHCASCKRFASKSPEQLVEWRSKAQAARNPSQASAAMRKRWASMTPEQRDEIKRNICQSWTKKKRRERSKLSHKYQASLAPEQRKENSRRMNAAQNPERRLEALRKSWDSTTPEQRSERMRNWWASISPELRRKIAINNTLSKRNCTPEEAPLRVRRFKEARKLFPNGRALGAHLGLAEAYVSRYTLGKVSIPDDVDAQVKRLLENKENESVQ